MEEKKKNSEKVINVEGLKKSFNSQHVLKGVDLQLYQGENLVILGKSGTGKSVLIKCLVRLIEPDEGSLVILSENIMELDAKKLTEYRKKVGFLFQGGALYDSMTVRENLLFPLERSGKGFSGSEMEDKIHETLKNVNLEDAIDKWPAELSGGMKKRIALARTLILHPKIILYDEPTTGLDAVTAKDISHLILEMQENYDVSSIIITHDINCAKITSNRILMLKNGKFYDEGTYDELSDSSDSWTRAFFK
jgi:phospholipid/cholesterol/gamma-HCH transport system ATP-binding protein